MGDISNQLSTLQSTTFDGPIAFPGLGLQFDLDKQVFGTFIHWYGVIIALGFLAAILVGLRLAKRENLNPDTILDIVIIGTPSAIIGARLYYCIFEFDQYKDNLVDIFKIWEGGLAIYGGIIGAVAATVIYCHVKKVKLSKILDIGGVGLVIGQAIGRWGNFVNREAFGSHASSLLPWRMRLYTDASMTTWADVHPTFLYESLWCVGVLCVLLWLYRKKKFDGQIFLSYVLLYGLGRLWIEGLRTDSLYLGPVRISQIVALVSAIAAGILLWRCSKKARLAAETPAGTAMEEPYGGELQQTEADAPDESNELPNPDGELAESQPDTPENTSVPDTADTPDDTI